MTFGQAIETVFRKYPEFSGRAARTEYWWWTLFYFLVSLVLGVIDGTMLFSSGGTGPLGAIATLVLLLPTIAVSARRLHDTDRSAWWLLLFFVPVIGLLVLLFFFVTKSDPGPNRFGDAPEDLSAPRAYAAR